MRKLALGLSIVIVVMCCVVVVALGASVEDSMEQVIEGFELPFGWMGVVFSGEATFTHDKEDVVDGSYSIKIETPDRMSVAVVFKDFPAVEKAEYTFKIWMKTDWKKPHLLGYLWIGWDDKDGNRLRDDRMMRLDTEGVWQEWGVVLEAPKNATSMRVHIECDDWGTLRIDKLQIVEGNLLEAEKGEMVLVDSQ